MGRQCVVTGCRNRTTLHYFPVDADMRRKWLIALGLPDDINSKAGVCNLHFPPDSFSNRLEVDMGFIKLLKLRSDAVPIPAPPVRPRVARPRPQELLPQPRLIAPKPTREIGCQTERVLTKHAFYQVDIKPHRRSKATETRPYNRDVSCDTGNSVGLEVNFEEGPVVSLTPESRAECEVFTDDSRSCMDETNTSPLNELPPDTMQKHIVYEDNLLELFRTCPVCSRSCSITKTVTGTFLQLKQTCAHCEYTHQWSSQPMVGNTPAGNLQLGAAVQISKVLDAFKIQGISETAFHNHQIKCLSNANT
ncbi:uncharacterized protein LOC131471989 isoform X1 [Solea solea]|uniref:uncharacterized protein LOC131471989 isoform X1 n=2 Tax=Solea solea TaxID=90069 RepID=UPI002729B103|nr:uncharacterized protein LOC131471989 isoform X1 [Solea solea]